MLSRPPTLGACLCAWPDRSRHIRIHADARRDARDVGIGYGNPSYKKSDGAYKKHWLSILNLRQYRGRFVAMFDDAKPVISTIRQMGIVCINAHKANARLA